MHLIWIFARIGGTQIGWSYVGIAVEQIPLRWFRVSPRRECRKFIPARSWWRNRWEHGYMITLCFTH